MYNLLEYGKNYKKTTGRLWNYYRDGPSDPLSSNSESFKYKTSIILVLVKKIMMQIKLVKMKLKLFFH